MNNRPWVKWTAIGFFIVMLLMTFFSGTIRNRSLPQIVTNPITAGTIMPVISGSGNVEAVGHDMAITAPYAGKILSVYYNEGDIVKKGDALFLVEYLDNGTLAAKEAELKQLADSYEESLMLTNIDTNSSSANELEILRNNLTVAQDRQAKNAEYRPKRESLDMQLASAQTALQAAEAVYAGATESASVEFTEAQLALQEAQLLQQNAQVNEGYYGSIDSGSEEHLAAKAVLESANAQVLELENRVYAAQLTLNNLKKSYQPAVDSAKQTVDTLLQQIAALEIEYSNCTDGNSCENALLSAQIAIDSFYDRQAATAAQDEIQAIRLKSQEAEINKIRQELEKIEDSLGTHSILAPCSGVLHMQDKEIFDSEGVLAYIQDITEYNLYFSTDIETASLLSVGTEAQITNQTYSDTRAHLKSILTDTEYPTNQKSLCFEIQGSNVTAGQFLSLSIVLVPSTHTTVVPNSAIHKDSLGEFVYVIQSKNSPLGTQASVHRVDVTVVRSDRSYAAVEGSLTTEDYVVVLSDAPLSDGQAVRFGD